MSKNILVTGGAGYIGSHTCKLLKTKGYNPIVFDSFENGHREFVKWGPAIEGNLHDFDKIKNTIKKYDIQSVIHFAAYAYVGESVKNPAKYFDNNVAGSLSLLKAMYETGVKNIVFSSSCATYGIPKTSPISESMPQSPINPYGLSKLITEQMIESFCNAYDFKAVILRYFNAAGASLECEIGEDHKPETHVIPLALAAADNGTEFSIFGNDYDTKDGTCIRDYIHVMDLADAHVRSLQYISRSQSKICEKINLGSEIGHSVQEIIQTVELVTGKSVKTRACTRREGDPASLIASSQKAKELLEWQPQIGELTEIIDSAWKWHLKHSNRSRHV